MGMNLATRTVRHNVSRRTRENRSSTVSFVPMQTSYLPNSVSLYAARPRFTARAAIMFFEMATQVAGSQQRPNNVDGCN